MCVNISSIKRIFSNQSHYFPDIPCNVEKIMGLFDIFPVIRLQSEAVLNSNSYHEGNNFAVHVKVQKGERTLFFGDAGNCYYSV